MTDKDWLALYKNLLKNVLKFKVTYQEAEELAQDALVAALERSPENPAAYAYRSSRNKSINLLRSLGPKVNYQPEGVEPPSMEEDLLDQERLELVLDALATLPEKQRRAVIEYYLDEERPPHKAGRYQSIKTNRRLGIIKLREACVDL